jgi:hypothetical protein
MENLKNKNILWIVRNFDPSSKDENLIFNCSQWLLNCGNSDAIFKSFNLLYFDYYAILRFDDNGTIISVKAYWSNSKWKWIFKVQNES